MKKLIVIISIFLLVPLKVNGISASSAVVMDLNSGRVLYNLNGNDKRLIASITKIMTTLITINYSDLDETVVVGDEILEAYGSSIYLEVGEEIKLRDLLYGLMLRSGNDAAIAIAYHVAGSMEGFAHFMNEYASAIGMKNTNFINSNGLDSKGVGNISTAYDMALLTHVAMQNETFREIFGTRNYQCKSNIKNYSWAGKNKLFAMYPYTTGGKTGYTDAARRTLVTTASKDNKNLVVVTLNDGNDFNDHKDLYETYFEKYESVNALDKNNFTVDDKHYKNISFYIKNDYYALVSDEEKDDLHLEIDILTLDNVFDNMKIGEVKVMLNDTVLHKENIYGKIIEENKKEKEGFFKRIIGWFKKW